MATVATDRTPYEAHRDYVLTVLSRRCGWLDPSEREAVFHDAYVVMLEKERSAELDTRAMRPQQLRAYLVQTAIHKALDEGKRAERKRSEMFGEDAPAIRDSGPAPDEYAEASQHSAIVREIVAELPERQQTIVKLRFFFDRSPVEIQTYMRITQRTYRRQLERAVRAISDRYELVREGRFCDTRRELIIAYVAGTADPAGARIAREHLASCSGCASWAAGLREQAHRVAALLPVPAVTISAGPADAAGRAVEAAVQGAGDLAGVVKGHAAGVIARLDPATPSYLAAARPGAAVATVAGCLTLAGGAATYCVVEGIPEPIRSLVGLERNDERDGAPGGGEPSRARRRAPAGQAPDVPVVAATPTPTPGADAPAEPQQPNASKAEPGAERGAATPSTSAEAAEEEFFGFEGPNAAPAAAPAPAPAPALSPAPAPEQAGEFDP